MSAVTTERVMLKNAVTITRILLGVFFFISGIANYLHLHDKGGLLETVTTSKLKLWGFGFEGIGPLPALIALPYAYLLPLAEIIVGILFVINRWIKWAGIVMMLMLFSFIIAFGLVGENGLFPNNESSWDKNVFLLASVWICIAYDDYVAKRQQKMQAVASQETGMSHR